MVNPFFENSEHKNDIFWICQYFPTTLASFCFKIDSNILPTHKHYRQIAICLVFAVFWPIFYPYLRNLNFCKNVLKNSGIQLTSPCLTDCVIYPQIIPQNRSEDRNFRSKPTQAILFIPRFLKFFQDKQ